MNPAQTLAQHPDPGVRVRQLQSLAPLPVVAQRLLADLDRKDLSLGQLSEVIEMDPALTARIVGLANSAYFANRQPVYSVGDAVGRVLGLDMVRNLALGIVLSGPFDTQACRAFDAERFWFTAMATATLSVPLLGLVRDREPVAGEWAYLAGLLHELGLLALCALFPAEMSKVLSQTDAAKPLAVRTRQALGIDAMEAGAVLARRWKLPEGVAVVMAHYDAPGYQGPHSQLSALVGLAACLAVSLHQGRDDPELRRPWLLTLGLGEEDITPLLQRNQPRVEALRALARQLAHP
ncbi:HDOD domain-containing protein [Thioalkalivibrio sulfidiphilus]|uniref:HDOD domain-containing protein n=1 Tax=Thioalkalivibrio sulfidiphilus TaxID=1033854 RepID=UPI00037FD77A|nr:HDOD domain-containing protein [Thioalkalivibrio sulfidiphilus]